MCEREKERDKEKLSACLITERPPGISELNPGKKADWLPQSGGFYQDVIKQSNEKWWAEFVIIQ